MTAPVSTAISRLDRIEDIVLSMTDATLRRRDRFVLADTNWTIHRGEQWAVIGPNGSGKSSLVGALAGRVPVVKGALYRSAQLSHPQGIGHVAFETHLQLIARDEALDEARHFRQTQMPKPK